MAVGIWWSAAFLGISGRSGVHDRRLRQAGPTVAAECRLVPAGFADGGRHEPGRDGSVVFDDVSSHESRPALHGERLAGPETRARPSELLGNTGKARSRTE